MSEKRKLVFLKYKHLLFAIIIIIVVIILDIILENYTKSSIQKVNSNIEKISKIFEKNDEYNTKKLEQLSKKSLKEWEKREEILTIFIEHEEVEKVSVKLHLLNTEIKNKLWSDAKFTNEETRQLMKYLNTRHKLSIQNIF